MFPLEYAQWNLKTPMQCWPLHMALLPIKVRRILGVEKWANKFQTVWSWWNRKVYNHAYSFFGEAEVAGDLGFE